MAPPAPVDSPNDESAVPLKKARRGRGSISTNVRAPPKEGRKRPNSMRRDDQQDGTPNSQSQPNSAGGSTPLQHPHSTLIMPVPPGKMLLPRLHQPKSLAPDTKASGKERTSHACDKCRKAKAKCSGGEPCEKCKTEGKECVYGDGKRDRMKKEADSLRKENNGLKVQSRNLIRFLNDLRQNPNVQGDAPGDIDAFLLSLKDIDLDPDGDGDEKRRGSGDTGEDDVDAQEVASMGSLDAINEDTNRDEATRAAGYLGKSSAVRWVQRTKDYLDEDEHNKGSQKDANQPDNVFMDATCHADDGDFPFKQIGPESVNMYDMPPMDLAQTLLNAYFKYVHPALPIVSEPDFREKFDKYAVHGRPPNDQEQIGSEQQNFLCSMNMVFAIAARHARVINADYQGSENDHLIYFARASAMGLDNRALHEDAELENTTSLGLVSLYFLTLEHINRAWTWSGVALRSALTLGLHLRSQTRSLSDVDKEYRIRIFWCCYSLERILNQLTGRPSCITPQDICANLPLNVNETDFHRDVGLYDGDRNSKFEFYGASAEAAARAVPPMSRRLLTGSSLSESHNSPMDTSPISKYSSITSVTPSESQDSQAPVSDEAIASQEITTSTYFIHHTRLSVISHSIFKELYSPTMMKKKWGAIEDVIRSMEKSLQTWRNSMPWQYRFDPENPRFDDPPDWRKGEIIRDQRERRAQWKHYAAQRIGLAMMWSSSRMLLYRPTLCRISQEIGNESDRSKTFNSDSASACVQSARHMVACLPPFDSDLRHIREGQFGPDVVGIHSFVPWWNTSHFIIEASSVLTMELAHRAEHVPALAERLFEDAKTAVAWMRHLATESVMAKKGSRVYEVLLRRVAPRIGRDAGPLTKDGNLPRDRDEHRSRRSRGDDNDTSSDTIRWSGHNESAARFEQHLNLGPNQSLAMHQPQQNYNSLSPFQQNHLMNNQQTTAPSPNTMYGQPGVPMSGAPADDFSGVWLNTLGLGALEDSHFAGSIYGVYDQFGPWYNQSFDNFGVFDPVMDARLGGGMDYSQAQNNSAMGGNSQMAGVQAQMDQSPMMNQNMGGKQQLGQPQQMGRQHYSHIPNASMMGGGSMANQKLNNQHMVSQNNSPHTQSYQLASPQTGPNGGIGSMSTSVSMPPVTASDMGMGRPFTHQTADQNHQQLPSMQQIRVGNMSNMQQGGGYPPNSSSYAWDGTLPPVNQQLPQHQGQQQQSQQHQNLPSLYGQGMNPQQNQGMDGQQGQSGQANQHGYHSHPQGGMNNQQQNHR